MKKRVIALALGCTVAFGCAVGGTLAWLTDSTDAVTNTFTTSDINITLDEKTGDYYKMVPGATLAKDPKVTVEANSEDCWLFVKVTENEGDWSTLKGENNDDIDVFDTLIKYNIAAGWTAVPDHAGYYYRTVSANTTADQTFEILDGQVTVDGVTYNGVVTIDDSVTKEMMNAITTTQPTLTFTAAAIQQANLDYPENATTDGEKVATAWAQLPQKFTSATT